MKFSFTLVGSCIFIAYMTHSIWTIARLFIPPKCHPGQSCIQSFLAKDPKLQMFAFTSVRRNPSVESEVKLVYNSRSFEYKEEFEKQLTIPLPQSVRNNGSLYLHVFVAAADWGKAKERENKHGTGLWINLMQDPFTVTAFAKITQYRVPQAETFKLLGDKEGEKTLKENDRFKTPVVHMKPTVQFTVLAETYPLPMRDLPPELAYLLRLAPDGTYLPLMQYNYLSSRISDLVEVKKDTMEANVTLAYAPIAVGRLRLMLQLESGLRSLKEFGFSAKDIDEVKGIFADTNIYLLCTTMFVAAVHLLFDFLALKNDVSFWRQTKSLVGLSTRTILWRAFSQAVIFMYLVDENTSMLVLVPAGLTTMVEFWKAKKCLRVHVSWRGVRKDPSGEAESKTQEFDQQCMSYLQYLLWPMCVGGAIYSLLYEPHTGWYSWTVHNLVRGVYAFGFLFMLPQLFINYKLKSVAHLPWRAFTYKAFNTFIDDLFAFTIKMPMAHRVACFRDDAVFLVYLYQRWLYPVDKSRVDHGGQAEEEHLKKD
ncbi:lipid scramblase CLPTM1L [Neocloeon triangulifer]|uniref:lipid scramblase CLPTM1L n=1 Tax=Neocloeon triangulifer TaxID=2078957 RepID=UPI00286F2571|nr:lipid scramblase CLPTM1L [Neocloeon triangulifer]